MDKEEALPLPIQDIRAAVNKWSQEGFFRVKGLGDRLEIENILPTFSYAMRLKSEYEHRRVTREQVPYHGGPVDDRGVPPDPWAIAVPMPQDFEDRQEQVIVPHTEQIETCGNCGGFGHVTCGSCWGSGQVTCSWCGGAGYRTRTETYTDTDSNGNTTTRTETFHDPCSCFNGRVTCSWCGGSGRVMCPRCEGSGQVKTFDLLTVTFNEERDESVVDRTDIPDDKIARARGDRVVQIQEARIGDTPPVTPEVLATTTTLLQQSQVLPADTRLLFQRLVTEQIQVQEVTYRYRKSEPKRLWVYGEPKEVYAPDAPKAWGRLVGVLAASGSAIALLVFFVFPRLAPSPGVMIDTVPTHTPQQFPNSDRPAFPTTQGYEGRIENVPTTPEEEINALRRQIQQSPEDAVLHDSLAQVYLRQKQPEKAVYHLKQVLKLAPGTERAETAQKTLNAIETPP